MPESVEPPSLIPPNILPPPGTLPEIPSAPELQQLSTLFKQSSLGKAADEYRLHLQMTKLEVQIRNDQDLHDLKADAGRASTDLERRHRLRTYYERYYEKLRARTDSPDLKAYLTAQEANHELPLLQPRVRHQSDEAAAAELVKKRDATRPAPPRLLPHRCRRGPAKRFGLRQSLRLPPPVSAAKIPASVGAFVYSG